MHAVGSYLYIVLEVNELGTMTFYRKESTESHVVSATCAWSAQDRRLRRFFGSIPTAIADYLWFPPQSKFTTTHIIVVIVIDRHPQHQYEFG